MAQIPEGRGVLKKIHNSRQTYFIPFVMLFWNTPIHLQEEKSILSHTNNLITSKVLLQDRYLRA